MRSFPCPEQHSQVFAPGLALSALSSTLRKSRSAAMTHHAFPLASLTGSSGGTVPGSPTTHLPGVPSTFSHGNELKPSWLITNSCQLTST